MSIQSNKDKNGRVDWGQVGVDSLIGGAASAVGGAASFGLSKAVPAMARSRVSVLQKAGTSRVLGKAGQAAISNSIGGGTGNALDVGAKSNWSSDADYGKAFGVGAATNGGFSLVSSVVTPKLGSAIVDRLNLEEVWSSVRRALSTEPAIAPNIAAVQTAVEKGVDGMIGGTSAAINEWYRPGHNRDLGNMDRTFVGGTINGAQGPSMPPRGAHAG